MVQRELAVDDFFEKDEFQQQEEKQPAPEQKQEENKQEPEQEPPKFVKEIDLGDGSGVQRFIADSPDELIEKLTEAQRNATKKIREQEQRLKRRQRKQRQPAPQPAPELTVRPLSPEELADVSQQWYQAPDKAFDRLFQARTGLTPEQFAREQQEVKQFKQALHEQQVAAEFMDQNEEYVPSRKNYRALMNFLEEENLEFTADNLQTAFEELKSSGLLELPSTKEKEPAPSEPAPKQEEKERERKASRTGLSARDTRSAPSEPKLPTADELDQLPREEARERILAALAQARGAGVQR